MGARLAGCLLVAICLGGCGTDPVLYRGAEGPIPIGDEDDGAGGTDPSEDAGQVDDSTVMTDARSDGPPPTDGSPPPIDTTSPPDTEPPRDAGTELHTDPTDIAPADVIPADVIPTDTPSPPTDTVAPDLGPPPFEQCDNRIDDDLDGLVDCADRADCQDHPSCRPPVEICDDGIDNDGDTRPDCFDSDCEDDPACGGPGEELECTNLIDDDGDGRVDCADIDCVRSPACSSRERCNDGFDNDGDGFIDCDDDDCDAHVVCLRTGVEVCTNRRDDDGDGLIDCDDPDCFDMIVCRTPDPESCVDDIDNDLDGRIDCADPDCYEYSACEEDGNCVNDADLAIVEHLDYTGLVFDCGIACFSGDSRRCARECVTDRTDLSAGCADCFGGVIECALNLCISQCVADPVGTYCARCVLEGCSIDFEACAGFELDI